MKRGKGAYLAPAETYHLAIRHRTPTTRVPVLRTEEDDPQRAAFLDELKRKREANQKAA